MAKTWTTQQNEAWPALV